MVHFIMNLQKVSEAIEQIDTKNTFEYMVQAYFVDGKS